MKPRAGLILELFVNLVLPWIAYRAAQPSFGETGALYASAVPPIIWSIVEFIRSRRVDAVAAIVLLGIALSILGMALGGSARTLLMRESLASGTIGVVFLLSLFRERPLIFSTRATVAREMDGGAAHFEAVWEAQPGLRQMLRRMTFVWGAFLTLEMLLRLWMVVTYRSNACWSCRRSWATPCSAVCCCGRSGTGGGCASATASTSRAATASPKPPAADR